MSIKDIRFKRILLKLSGEALKRRDEPIDAEALSNIATQLKAIQEAGIEVGIVVGGGNFWRARSAGGMERNRADHMGMLATAMNGIALCDALLRAGVDAKVMSAVDMQRFCDTYSAREAHAALDKKTILIVTCGSGSPFFTTDTASALRACEIGADALFLAKNVDALYDKNPDTCPDAKRLENPSYDEVIAMNQKCIDITAITMCKEQRIPIVIFPLAGFHSILDAVNGKNIGTIIDS